MDSTKELTLDESVKQVMQTLPPPIKKYLYSGKYSEVAKGLMKKYELHIDQGTVLERELMLLLMGIETPQAFNDALIEEAKIVPEAVNALMLDVNAQIFIPLRDQMRAGGAKAPSPAVPASEAPQAPSQPRLLAPQPAPVVAKPPPPPAYKPSVPAPPTAPQQGRPPALEAPLRPAEASREGGRADLAAAIGHAMQSVPVPLTSPHPAFPTVAPAVPAQRPPVEQKILPTPELVKEAIRNAPVAPQSAAPVRRPYAADPYREPVEP